MKIDPRTVVHSQQLPPDAAAKRERDLASLRNSCREFEAIYVQEMFKAMRATIPEGGLYEKDIAQNMYTEMLDMEMAQKTAEGPGMGIGEAMYQQMKGHLERQKLPEER